MIGRTGISGKLVTVAAVSLLIGYFIGREHLKYEIREQSLQNPIAAEEALQKTVTSAIAEEIRLYVQGIDGQVESLIRMLEITGAVGDVADPNYAGALDRSIHSFVDGGGERPLPHNRQR